MGIVKSNTYQAAKELISSLSLEEQQKISLWLRANPSVSLQDMIDVRETLGVCCPECGKATSLVKYGKTANKIQRYHCKECKITFNSLSYSFISNSKKSFNDWLQYFQCMMEGWSIRKSAEYCGISVRTAFFWRHKILDLIREKLSRIKLDGIVEADDTFIRQSFKGNTPVGREPRKRGCNASKPGISKEQVCITTAIDRTGKVFAEVSATGRATSIAIKKVLLKRLRPKAVLCTDNDSSYRRFCKKYKFEHIILKENRVKGIYHINNINAYHSRLKSFLRRFRGGIATKYLNNYLSWQGTIFERKLSLIQVLKAVFKEDSFKTWKDIKNKPLMPV